MAFVFSWPSQSRLIDIRNKTLLDLTLDGLFTNKMLAFNNCLYWGLLADDTECEFCGTHFRIMIDNSDEYGIRVICPFCNIRRSIFHNTLFSYSHISPAKVLHLLYFWSQCWLPCDAEIQIQLSQPTITNYFQAFRDACQEYVDFNSTKIGGQGFIVQIDESQYVKRKNHQGRPLPNTQIWIFGGICTATKKIFATPVTDRSAATLLPLIQENIESQTLIMSDQWPAYNGITRLPEQYSHQEVNHSQNFIDPITGANTQLIERYWQIIKAAKQRYKGIPGSEVKSHIAEAVWRNNCGVQKENAFEKAIELIRQTHYTHQ